MDSEASGSHHSQSDDAQQDEEAHLVEFFVKQFSENKITKNNVWNCAIIDKVSSLVSLHHKYISNFSNVAKSLEAMTKVYELRVDSIWHDVQRMGHGMRAAGNGVDKRSPRPNQAENELDDGRVGEDLNAPPRRSRRRRLVTNIATNLNQLNARLDIVKLPDVLTSQLNVINDDIAASSRLFVSVLPTNEFVLRLSCDRKYIDQSNYEFVKFQENYENGDQLFFKLPCNLCFDEQLPIRPKDLAGYRIQNTPLEEDNSIYDESFIDVEQDIAPEYVFDNNAIDNNDWQNLPTDVATSQDYNDDFPASLYTRPQDSEDSNNNNENNNNDEYLNHGHGYNIQKGEYSYHAFDQIKNYWAGPSYWKVPRKQPIVHNEPDVIMEKPRKQRGKKRNQVNPLANDDSDSDEYFIETTSRKAKRIRLCNYKQWKPEKLMLPSQMNISKDFFNTYTFNPSHGNVHTHPSQAISEPNTPENANEDYDYHFGDDDFPDLSTQPEANTANVQPEAVNDISITVEDPPQVVEKIHINFDKRPKVVNMGNMQRETWISIKKQLDNSAKDGCSSGLSNNEGVEPGKALFSSVFKDLKLGKKKFMSKRAELTTSLVLFSVLSVVNSKRLCLSSEPDPENDFEIGRLKKIGD